MANTSTFSRSLLALSASLACASTHAQPATTLEQVTVTGRSDPTLGVGGWGDVPLSKSPFQASVITTEQMRDSGIQRLSDVTRIDPSVSDAYNAEGYWDFLTVRGFVIDNRFNYRRDGLPINAETSIPLDNKERIELLKGTSGLQAGTSAPGGLVNFVVKRPLADSLRSAQLAWRQPGSVLGAVDISERFGAGKVFGLRVNAAAEHLDPPAHNAKGERNLMAIAGDWRIGPDTLLEAEFETSHRSQPSVPGFSLLGPNLPAPGDPRINLNNQPWSLPVVLDGNTASVRFSQGLAAGWRWTAHAATQQLTSQDRIAFPYGCGAEGNFDRYCSDGTF
ncbi:MAG TPA: TonB-dependent receptor plug domain-containing protein, partial [Albitalea sp.]|nr:TonB-dependent receptor plug domain-containing protein [Albitalea sp.]